MSWLGLFLKTVMDMLFVSRVDPTQSLTYPAERGMGPINLALQNCALLRTKMRDDAMELHMKRCSGTSAVRVKAQEFSHVRDAPRAPREHTIAHDVPHPLPSTVP